MKACPFRRTQLIACILSGLAAAFASPASATCLNPVEDTQLCETREIRFRGPNAAALSAKAAELGNAAAIYAHLRNNADYTPYVGAHSDSINGFGGLSGNDVDLASTLIAMLRSQGIKARYVDGRAEVSNQELANWLRMVTATAQLPFAMAGINYSVTSQSTNFSHVWVEALVPYRAYRGAIAATCTVENADCRWVALDPSFKQKHYNHPEYRLLLRGQTFDYTGYFNAENKTSPNYNSNYQNKNPETIFEETALKYLWQNKPGVTLNDVADPGSILPDLSGLLPASLPYKSTVNARYDSVDDYDTAAIAAGSKTWSKYLNVTLQVSSCGDQTKVLPSLHIPMAAFTSSRLTFGLTNPSGTRQLGFHLDGVLQGNAVSLGTTVTCTNGTTVVLADTSKLDATVSADLPDGSQRTASYPNLIIDGYYLVANGADVANQSQAQRAYAQLEAADAQYPLLTDTTGSRGTAGEVYVDANGNGVIDPTELALMDHPQARDALTGGLLDVASRIYLASLRSGNERYQLLRDVLVYPLASFGVVSTAQAVQYLNSTSFGISPKGLVVDLRGFFYTRAYQADTGAYDAEAFKFEGHYASSLEHEVWQKVTGLDAISTMRGFQTSLNEGQSLLDIKSTSTADPIPGMLSALGFSASAPPSFTPVTYNMFGRSMYTWSGSSGKFNLIRANANGVAASVLNAEPGVFDTANNIQPVLQSYYNNYNWLLSMQALENKPKTYPPVALTDNIFTTMDIVKTEVTSPSGFVDSVVRQSGSNNTYLVTISETVAQPAATITVATKNYLATTGKYSYDFTIPGNKNYTSTNSPLTLSTNNAAFTVTGKIHHIHSPTPITLNQVGNVADNDNLVVQVLATGFLLNRSNQRVKLRNAPIFQFPYSTTRNNRVIEQISNVGVGGIDTSYNVTLTCPNGTPYTDTATHLLTTIKNQCFEPDLAKANTQGFNIAFFDQNAGFNPNNYWYRDASASTANTQPPVGFLKNVQTDIYGNAAGGVDYLFPTAMPYGPNYLFNVYLKTQINSDGSIGTQTFAIQNQQ